MNHLAAERTALGLTQQQLGERVGVSRQTIIAIENGKYSPRLDLAFRLAGVVKKSVEQLFQHGEETKGA
jgi:putative transcriptional regulator